jgi:hypothetical protein
MSSSIRIFAITRRGFCSQATSSGSLSEVRTFVQSPPELYRLTPKLIGELPQIAQVNEIIDLSEKVHQMRLKRMQLLSLPASSVTTRNKELMALAIGAVSGALSLSFHPAFGLIFIVSYRMYRSASKPTRERFEGAATAKDLQNEIQVINARIQTLVSDVQRSVPSIVRDDP